MDPRVPAAVAAFVNAPSSTDASALFDRDQAWLCLPETRQIFSASMEGHGTQTGHERDVFILEARWDLLDRLLEVGTKAALAGLHPFIEAVLEVVNVPAGTQAVINVDPKLLARREANWVVADLLIQQPEEETAGKILQRWQAVREAIRGGDLKRSPASTVAPTGAVVPPSNGVRDDSCIALPDSVAQAEQRRDLRLSRAAGNLDSRHGDRAANLREALTDLQQVQDELLAGGLYATNERDRERLLRTYVMLGVTYQAIAYVALQQQGDAVASESCTDTALEAYEEAIRLAGNRPIPLTVALTLHNGLAEIMSRRGERKKAVEHYLTALDLAKQAGRRAGAAEIDYNLGDELAKMDAELPGAQLLAIDHFRRALGYFDADTYSGQRQQTLRSLGRLLFKMRDWEGAERAYSEAIALSENELAQSDDPATQRRRVQESAALFAPSAFCLLRLGRVRSAVERIEQGKARIATRRGAALLPGTPAADLFAGAPAGGAVVTTVITEAGAAAIVIPEGISHPSASNIAWLDANAERSLFDLAYGPEGWLNSYFRLARTADTDRQWDQAIDRIAGALWPRYVGPIIERLQALGVPSGAEVAIVPQGGLSAMPIACAWRMVDGQRRYAIEDFAFSQAPSLGLLALARCLAREPSRQDLKLLAVDDPLGDLGGASDECRDVVDLFVARGAPQPIRVQGEQATAAAVRAAMPLANCWLLACHGHFHWGTPALSALELAHDTELRLAEIASESGATLRVRLAALSACESGISDVVRTPDEFDGFPATLMSLGVPAVLATLWQVEDTATARLVARFFAHWLADWPHRSPACALRLAQLDVMAMPLADFEPGVQTSETLRDRVFYWGSFVLSGA